MSLSTSSLLLKSTKTSNGLLLTDPVELDLSKTLSSEEDVPVSISLYINGVTYGELTKQDIVIAFGCDGHGIIYEHKCRLKEREPITILWSGMLNRDLGKVKIYNVISGATKNTITNTGNALVQFTVQM